VNPQLIAVGIQVLPGVIDFLRQEFGKQHPAAAVPTDEEVMAAYQQALASSLAKDEQWLAAHPQS
jgi:hypothetical protein